MREYAGSQGQLLLSDLETIPPCYQYRVANGKSLIQEERRRELVGEY